MDESLWQKRHERQKSARQEAERLLEEKSLEVYEANWKLSEMVDRQRGDIALRDSIFLRLSKAFLELGVDHEGNVGVLTATCGELLEASRARYLRLEEDGTLLSTAEWSAPGDPPEWPEADGVWDDALASGAGWRAGSLAGQVVRRSGVVTGVLELLHAEGREPSALDSTVIEILAGAIGIEEDRSRDQQAIRVAREEADRGNQAKSLFLATMSHEMRTPLTGVIGYSDLLLSEVSDEATREGLEVIRQSGGMLLGIINDILDYTRIESGKVELSCQAFDLYQLVRETLTVHRLAADQKEIMLEFSHDDESCDRILGDESRLRQVLHNVVGNAIKFTQRGRVSVRVEKRDGVRRGIVVQDSGCGFDPSNAELLFQPFFQENSPAVRKQGGTGLGLAVCRSLLRAMGGTIEARNRTGGGAEFSILLPEGIGATEPAAQPATLASRADDLPVLIAEDHEVNAKLLQRMLGKLGHASLIAGGGREVLALLGQRPFRTVLMDLRMPDMDGLEAARAIRAGAAGESNREIPIIAVTANAFPADREACRDAGMDAFVEKPVDLDKLKSALDAVHY